MDLTNKKEIKKVIHKYLDILWEREQMFTSCVTFEKEHIAQVDIKNLPIPDCPNYNFGVFFNADMQIEHRPTLRVRNFDSDSSIVADIEITEDCTCNDAARKIFKATENFFQLINNH